MARTAAIIELNSAQKFEAVDAGTAKAPPMALASWCLPISAKTHEDSPWIGRAQL
jgi:hypothetical protein